MKPFDYLQPTEIRFGRGRVAEVGKAVARFGERCVVVTEANVEALEPVIAELQTSLAEAGGAVELLDGVLPNPVTDTTTAGGHARARRRPCPVSKTTGPARRGGGGGRSAGVGAPPRRPGSRRPA